MILTGNEILKVTKGHNCVVYLRKAMRNKPRTGNVNAQGTLHHIPSIRSQDIERKKIPSRNHAYIVLTPLKPHLYIVKLGFTGVYNIFLISPQNTECGYSLEPPRRGGSNEYPQFML